MKLVSPATYLSVADFRAMDNDYDVSGFTDSDLQGKLVRASAVADSMMKRSLLAQEQTIRYYGNETNRLDLLVRPLLYVKRVQVIVPGTTGISLPLAQLLIDYRDGEALEYTPLLWMGAGLSTMFPHNVPVDVQLAWGYGANILKAPTWTTSDVSGSLTAGNYNVAIVPRTMYGEFPTTPKVVTTVNGALQITVNPVLGAYVYRTYASDATHNTTLTSTAASGATTFAVGSTTGMNVGDQWLVDSEIVTLSAIGTNSVTLQSATLAAHNAGATLMPVPTACVETPFTAFGNAPLGMTLSSLKPVDGMWADMLPVTDTSMPLMPQELVEAVRLITLSGIFENNNLANRGIYMTDDGKQRVSWVSTEGRSGKGKPTLMDQAAGMLAPLSLQAIY